MSVPSLLGAPIAELDQSMIQTTAIGGSSPRTMLNFNMQRQLQTNWCWSAVSTSVSLFYNMASTWTQCNLVDAELNQTTCCSNGASTACNKPWRLQNALTRTNNFAGWQPGVLSGTQISAQLSNSTPIGVRIGWAGGNSGHFIVISGTSTVGNRTHLNIEDPWSGQSTYEYSRFLTQYNGNGRWTHTYFTRR